MEYEWGDADDKERKGKEKMDIDWEPSKGKTHNLRHSLSSCGSCYPPGKFYERKMFWASQLAV